MKDRYRHIITFAMVWLCVLCMSSCVYDHYADIGLATDEQIDDVNKALFVLHITRVNTRATSADDVQEKIKSLRVIAIGRENGVIEINRLVKFDAEEASSFGYVFTWYTSPGQKDFYIIANEESVGEISYQEDMLLSGVNVNNRPKVLTDFLDSYKAYPASDDTIVTKFSVTTKDNNSRTTDDDLINAKKEAEEFKSIIKEIHFAPQYDTDTKEIFLPYTTCYENVDVKAWKDNGNAANSQTMYLVPVATKFYFRFYNYHQNIVEIKNLSIKSIASQNFLLGNVEEPDLDKDFDGEEMYWVDWLAKVAEKTQDSQLDNEDINEQYGWIYAYKMPNTNEHKESVLIKENNAVEIPIWTDENQELLYLGPYYFPESSYKQESNTTQEQNYLLHLHLHDMEVNSATSNDFNEDLVIGNVKSLFRNTYVLIQVTMRRGDVKVYAEMAPWVHKEVDGWADGGSIIP